MYFKDCTLTKTSDDNPHKKNYGHDMMKMRTTILRLGIRLQKSKKYYYFLPKYDAYKKRP